MRIDKFITDTIFDGEKISYNAVTTSFYDRGVTRVDVMTHELNFYGDGVIFANEFLAEINRVFGTNYEYSEDYKNERGKKHGNNNIHKAFVLKKSWGETYNLEHQYDYDSVKNCASDYGDYTKETLLNFADAVDRYNKGIKKTTDFAPDYKLTEKSAEIEKTRAEEERKVNEDIAKAVSALETSLDGDLLNKSIGAVKSGYDWTFVRIRDKYYDAKQNIHLDEMENITRIAYSKLKLYKDYFKGEIVNNKRDRYCSTDDRYYHTWSGMRIEEKNGDSYFSITPHETEDGIRFAFYGEIVIKKYGEDDITNKYDLTNLTFEELLMVNDLYNEMWHSEKWGK